MKVIEIISALSPAEKARAQQFLASEYHNKDRRLLDIFEIICTTINVKDTVTRDHIWKKLFPSKKLNDGLMRNLLSRLQDQLLKFCAVERFLSDDKEKALLEANSIMDLNLKSFYSSVTKRIDELLQPDNQSNLDVTSKFQLIKKSGHLHEFFEGLSRIKDVQFASELVNRVDNAIIDFYNTEKIRNALLALSVTQKLGDDYVINLKLQDYDFSSLKTDSAGMSDYFLRLLKLVKYDQGYDQIDTLISFVPKLAEVNKSDALIAFETIHNYLIKVSKSGVHKDFGIDFRLYKTALESGLLFKKGVLESTIYRNIVFVACRVEEYQWALTFIDSYRTNLTEDQRQSNYSLSKARIYNNMGAHEEVINALRNVEYDDIVLNLNSRLMLMMAFYELDEYDTLLSTINAFKVFLRRRRNVSVQRKSNFRDFCDVVYNLIRAGEREDPARVLKAREIASANPGIPSAWWLKEKIYEMSLILKMETKNAISG